VLKTKLVKKGGAKKNYTFVEIKAWVKALLLQMLKQRRQPVVKHNLKQLQTLHNMLIILAIEG
jgi:hypothetical protein